MLRQFHFAVAIALALLATSALAQASWEPTQSLIKITVSHHDQYRIFDKMGMPIVDVRTNYVKALATAEQLAQVRAMGFPVEIILKDYTREFEEKDYPPLGTPGTQNWDFYHSYAQVRDTLKAIALRHPAICKVESLGLSVQNRVIWGIRISDNVNVRENEPRFRIVGNQHGNEHIGCEPPMYMATILADSYGVSTRLTQIVDNYEIMIIPMANPDGATANTRSNANGVDLNRDMGYMWLGDGGSTAFFSQPESKILKADADAHAYAMSLAFHSGAYYVNYLWNYTPVLTQDDAFLKRISAGYDTWVHYDTTNGWAWYQTNGDIDDFSYGLEGTFDTTIEIYGNGYNPPTDSILPICQHNKEAILYQIRKCSTGIHGIVTDINNSLPIQALIRPYPLSRGQDWFLYSSKENGDYHRPVLNGTYSLKVSANGYRDTVVSNIVVPDTVNPVIRNVQMTPGGNYAAIRVVAVRQDDNAAQTNTTLTPWVLGMPDTKSYAMGPSGRIILDMGQGTEIVDGTGPDVRVTEYPNASHAVQCSVSNSWTGPWTSLGSGNGTCSFDLAGHGISLARYVLLRSGASGYSLDAVEALNHATGVEQGPPESVPYVLTLTSYPNPFRVRTTISSSCPAGSTGHPRSLSIYDISGRLVRILSPQATRHTPYEYVWDGKDSQGRSLPGGVYFYRLASLPYTATEKVVLIR
jgi:carboxypeptidase T